MGAVVPMFRTSRPIAIPNPRLPGFDTSRLRRPFGTTDPASAEPPPVGQPPIYRIDYESGLVKMMIGWGAAVAVAGLFWAVTNSGKSTANRRHKRRSSSSRPNRRRSQRSRMRRNSSEIIVRYGQNVDHRTPFYEEWYSDGRSGGLTSVADLSAAKDRADQTVAKLKRAGFSARTRKESLGWAANPRHHHNSRLRRNPHRKSRVTKPWVLITWDHRATGTRQTRYYATREAAVRARARLKPGISSDIEHIDWIGGSAPDLYSVDTSRE
jgi:hypothetical protein